MVEREPRSRLKKKVVPSDPGNSAFTDRHARSESGIHAGRTLSPLLPSNAVRHRRITAPEHVSQLAW